MKLSIKNGVPQALTSPPKNHTFDHPDFQAEDRVALVPIAFLSMPQKKWNTYSDAHPFLIAKRDGSIWEIVDGTGDDWARQAKTRDDIKKELSCILYSELYIREAGDNYDYERKHAIIASCQQYFGLKKGAA